MRGANAEDAAHLAPLLGGMLRTLRRVGLKEEASRLLVAIEAVAHDATTIAALVTRVQVAGGLAYLGDAERPKPIFEAALAALSQPTLVLRDRLALTRATARALASMPITFAVEGLTELVTMLRVVTDSFNTNSHVCLSVLDFMESIVLGFASDDLVLDSASRLWLDEDEHLVRRRIHRDLSRAAGEAR